MLRSRPSVQDPGQSNSNAVMTRNNISRPNTEPGQELPTCLALNPNNASICSAKTLRYSHKLCPRHHRELKNLTTQYTCKKNEAENIEKAGEYKLDERQALALISIKEAEIGMRSHVQMRFFSRAADNLGHSQRILLLQSEVRSLKKLIKSSPGDSLQESLRSPEPSADAEAIQPEASIHTASSPSSTEQLGVERKMQLVRRSRLSQQVPMEELNDLDPDHPLLAVKRFMTEMADSLVNKLIEIVPALDDSPHVAANQHDPSAMASETGDNIIRNWFRRLVVARGRPDELNLASRKTSIIEFLRSGVEVEELRKYVEYYEEIDINALRHLRRAVSDTFLAEDRPHITVLGGSVSIEDVADQLSTERWDMVFCFFKDVIPWELLPCLYLNFSDTAHMSKLLLLGRYGQGEDWCPEENPLHDCELGTYLGFVLSTQGSCDPPAPTIVAEGQGLRETEHRNYVAGRMSTNNPLAEPFLLELRRRTRLYLVVAWKGANLDEFFYQSNGDFTLRRTRTARTHGDLDSVKNDLRHQRSLLVETYEDYWQFLIVDRMPCQQFVLLQVISDVLAQLNGQPSIQKIVEDVIREVVPSKEQETYLQASGAAFDGRISETRFTDIEYEGNRSRCWDTESLLPELLDSRKGTKVPIDYARFITALCGNLESKGTIRIAEEFTPPQGVACAFPGSDGKLDLYIDYKALIAIANPSALPSSFDLPTEGSLLSFARAFKRVHGNALFAKGSIVTHYCAWPIDAVKHSSRGLPNFTTPEGHIYEWLKAPFDYPFSAKFCQYLIRHRFQECATFSSFHLTTFVICAIDTQDAAKKVTHLHEVAEKHGLKLSIPPISLWVDQYERTGLEKLYNGVRPAGHE